MATFELEEGFDVDEEARTQATTVVRSGKRSRSPSTRRDEPPAKRNLLAGLSDARSASTTKDVNKRKAVNQNSISFAKGNYGILIRIGEPMLNLECEASVGMCATGVRVSLFFPKMS